MTTWPPKPPCKPAPCTATIITLIQGIHTTPPPDSIGNHALKSVLRAVRECNERRGYLHFPIPKFHPLTEAYL